MKNIDLDISNFLGLYKYGHFDKAHLELQKIRKKYPLNPKISKLILDLSSFEPNPQTQNKIKSEFDKNRFISVVNACGTLLNKNPYSIWLLHVIGLAFTNLEKYTDAKIAFERLLDLDRTNKKGLLGIANLYFKANQVKTAAKFLEESLKFNGEDEDVIIDLALAQNLGQDQYKALDTIHNLLKKTPTNQRALIINAIIRNDLGDIKSAESSIVKIIKSDNSNYQALHILAGIHHDKGDDKNSEDLYRKIISSKAPLSIVAKSIYSLSNYANISINDPIIKRIFSILNKENLNSNIKSDLYFSLYNINHRNYNYDKAYTFLEMGNNLKRDNSLYDIKTVINYVEKIKMFFQTNHKEILNLKLNFRSSTNPIFIVGMPRSGTTLLENILAQKDSVSSLGELTYLEDAAKEASSINEINSFFETVNSNYFNKINNHNVVTDYFVDKMPNNFKFIGLIAECFPKAKIIHMDRSPQAVCWSQYKTNFGSSGQDYSYDKELINKYYNMYSEMMKFWMHLYGNRIINIKYEEMVDNPQSVLSNVFEKLGFDWDNSYLDYHKKRKRIRTASKEQANRPIYKGSSEEWLNYKDHLKEFAELKRFYEN